MEVNIYNKETGKLVFTFINVSDVSLRDGVFYVDGLLGLCFPLNSYNFKVSNPE